MRLGAIFRARTDMVELLLRHGRLADVQMLHFFSAQVAREMSAAAAVADGVAKSVAEEAAAASLVAGDALAEAGVAKRAAVEAFRSRCATVQRLATRSDSPTGWLREAYGDTTWSTPYSCHATLEASSRCDDAETATVSGTATAAGAHGTTPSAVDLVVRLTDHAEPAVATVSLQQPTGKVSTQMVNGLLKLTLRHAKVTLKPGVSAKATAATQHILTAAAYAGLLKRLEEVCALHATNTVRYDGLLIRNPAVQMRLSYLACFRFGVESLMAYVIGDGDADSADDNKLSLPLMESVALNMYAEAAMMDGLDATWDVVRDVPLCRPVPHKSAPAVTIDYPFVEKLIHTPKYSLTSLDGSMELQAMEFLGPLLADTHLGQTTSPWRESSLYRLLGMSAGRTRLVAPHVNLRLMAGAVENDVAALVHTIATAPDRKDPIFAYTVGQYLSELMANIAVLYRCTASLTADEEGKGHRAWLLTQAFCAASAARRQKIMADYAMSKVADKVLRRAKDLDGYSTHPVELMNAAPRKASVQKAT